MHSTKIYLHSLKRGVGSGGGRLNDTANNSSDPIHHFTSGVGEKECIMTLLVSSLGGSSLSSLANSDTVKAPGSVGPPRQPHYARRQAVRVLDLSTQHRAADRTALLRRHLLAPLDPRAPWRGEATVRGVVCPAAPGLRAQSALAG